MTRPVPFAVLFQDRCGSTYLMEALGSHPDIRAELEKFEGLRAERQVAEIRRLLTSTSPRGAVGFKNKLRDIREPAVLGEMLRDVGARIICLTRRNTIKQTVSLFNAIRLNEVTGDWNLYNPEDALGSFVVDVDQFDKRLRRFEYEKSELGSYVTNLQLPSLFLHYEDVLLHHDATMAMTLGFLGIREGHVTGSAMKNTSDNLRDVISNFDDLRAHYTGTRYEAMFDEVLAVPDSEHSEHVEVQASTASMTPGFVGNAAAGSLDGRTFRDITPHHQGDVGGDTRFAYREDPDGVVHARYEGGSVRLGYLVGKRTGDSLDVRYTHLTVDGETAAGLCTSRIETLDDGRLRLHETWEWTSRSGTGTSVVEETMPGD